jgi:hypothetical protein
MPLSEGTDRFQLRFSLGRLMLFVGVCALAFAMFRPSSDYVQRNSIRSLLALVPILPLLLALAAGLFLGPPPVRNWLCRCVGCGPYILLVGLIAVLDAWALIRHPQHAPQAVLSLLLIALFFCVFAPWILTLIPKRCPRCGRRHLLWDDIPAKRGQRRGPMYGCWSCGAGFRQGAGASWEPIALSGDMECTPVPADATADSASQSGD